MEKGPFMAADNGSPQRLRQGLSHLAEIPAEIPPPVAGAHGHVPVPTP
jgi:hypothetical protein